MKLSKIDSSGRPHAVATEQTTSLKIDSIITVIWEQQDSQLLAAMGVSLVQNSKPAIDLASGKTTQSCIFLIGDV